MGQAKQLRGKTWVLYDATFRRQVGASGNHHWSEVNSTLHASCYSGEALSGLGCELCMSRTRTTRECSFCEIDEGPTRLLLATNPSRLDWRQLPPSGEVCRLWNENSVNSYSVVTPMYVARVGEITKPSHANGPKKFHNH